MEYLLSMMKYAYQSNKKYLMGAIEKHLLKVIKIA